MEILRKGHININIFHVTFTANISNHILFRLFILYMLFLSLSQIQLHMSHKKDIVLFLVVFQKSALCYYLFVMPLSLLLSLFLTFLFPSCVNSHNYSCETAEFKSDCRIDYWVHRETHVLTYTHSLLFTHTQIYIHLCYFIISTASQF